MFARAEYDPTRPSVEAVLDSSRYFVVRVEDAGKKAYIGIGFAERTDSFDFSKLIMSRNHLFLLLMALARCCSSGLYKVCYHLLPFLACMCNLNWVHRRRKALLNPPSNPNEQSSPHIPPGLKKDYSLKEGQTFSIAIPGRSKTATGSTLLGSSSSTSSTSTGASIPLLPPPPSATKRR